MGLARKLAVRGMIPSPMKVAEIRDNLYRLMTELAVVLDERFGEAGRDAVAEVFRRLGTEDAGLLRERLELGDSLQDALDAWLVVGGLMGAKIRVRWVNDSRVETEHPYCPQHAAFVKRGSVYCDTVCLPYVEALAKGISHRVRMDVVVPADMSHTCTKALYYGGDPNEQLGQP